MIGQQIGQYKIIAPIGQGGMATVYRAHQAAFDRFVAIKVLGGQFSGDPTFVKRFQREAKVVARIEHRFIVPMYDYGEAHSTYYIVMRLIEGGTLRKLMVSGKLDLASTARIITQVAEALDYAHTHNVIHRDLKPSNILLDERGNAYLTDFGIAKMMGSNTQVTASGVVGTPSYMSPEQCQGKTLGPASDIYALGAILFEMLTGQVPYEADTPLSVMYMHVKDPIPSARALNSRLPAAIDRVMLRALAKLPKDRYPTASALAASFREVCGIEAEPVVRPRKQGLLDGLFKKQPAPAPAVLEMPVPEESLAEQPPADLNPAPEPALAPEPAIEVSPAAMAYQDAFAPPFPAKRSATQTMLAAGLGGIVLLGLVGTAIYGLATITPDGGPLFPTLPPPMTPALSLQTPTDLTLPVTPTEIGVIIEPSLIPPGTDTPAPIFPTQVPLSPTPLPLPSLTPIPVTDTSVPPTNTAVPTDTPVPPTNAPIPPVVSGKIVYTEGLNASAEIVVIDANGQNRRSITVNGQYEGEPDWSPGGALIAFEATVNSNTDIYTMGTDGSNVIRLTSSAEKDRHPDWSQNGALIAYESGEGDSAELYAMFSDGSNQTRLTNNSFGDRAPQFSPDGTRIAYMTHQRGKWEIAIMAYPGGSQIAIYDCPAPDCRFPAWSPNGSLIAYNSYDSATSLEKDIWLLNVASGASTPLVQGAENGRPDWSGDGQIIYFNRTLLDQTNIFRVNVSTGEITQITFSTFQAYGPDWIP